MPKKCFKDYQEVVALKKEMENSLGKKEDNMQEVYQDGTMGETHVKNTIEDLLPHIKKSLENPKVAYVKVYRGKTLVAGIKKPGIREEKRVVAIEEMKDLSLKE